MHSTKPFVMWKVGCKRKQGTSNSLAEVTSLAQLDCRSISMDGKSTADDWDVVMLNENNTISPIRQQLSVVVCLEVNTRLSAMTDLLMWWVWLYSYVLKALALYLKLQLLVYKNKLWNKRPKNCQNFCLTYCSFEILVLCMYRNVMLLFVRSVAVYQGIYILEYYKIS